MIAVELAYSTGEHDRFEKGPALAVMQLEIEGAGKSLDQWLTEFVTVVRGAVACLDFDIQG